MKCADCKIDHRCNKEGFDCTGGKLELAPYLEEDNKPFHRVSGYLQKDFGNNLTRLEELIRFCKTTNYKKLGLAFCIGLAEEAKVLCDMLEAKGFKVESVCCKCGGLNKEAYNVPNVQEDKIEILCNPMGQAELLNKAKVDLNIELGLCVGHDILFHKYAEAPVTVFAVKDRVLANNPLGVVYSSYSRKRINSMKID